MPVHAQTAQKPERVEDPNPTVIARAEEITGRPDREIVLTGDVELIRGATRVVAKTACFKQVEDEVSASGNVFMWRFGDHYTGDELKLNLSSGKGYVLNPTYKMELNNAQGKASRLDFISEDEAFVTNATYSTCEGTKPDWYLKARTLRLDAGRDVGVAGQTVLYFKDFPILGAPALSFSLSGARRSGWLPPDIGFGSKGRFDATLPYYFNIAPNRDLTLFPRIMLDRGLQMGATGRYIGETAAGSYEGRTHLELLLNDKEKNTNRWLVNSTHSQALARGLSFGWNLNAASDDDYPSDFSKSIATSAERQLLREVRVDYRKEFWSLSARAQGFQVLQDPAAATDPTLFVQRPYDRLPEVVLTAGRFDVNGFDWNVDAQMTRFSHPDLPSGNRMVVVPQVSYPIVRPGYHITPKLSLHASAYSLERTSAIAPRTLNRVLPTFSVDSGLVFERPSTLLGRDMVQTLEPRLFYVYTPYKDQRAFPNFDSAEASFNLAQIFNENRFIGSDRVADANQVTAAVVSRFLESNGAERMRVVLGQRFYLTQQRVQLSAVQPIDESRSDVLAAASGRISDNWSFDSAIQYNANKSSVVTSNYGVQWTPGQKKVVNAEYRYVRDSFKNIDISSQWPLSKRWYGVGRISYSLQDKKILESLVGLEYQADCWVFRMGAQRFVTTLRNTSTPIFFQLELNGLSKLGPGNALETFYKSIPGYARLNPGVGR
ncbi:MAG: LPS-assembly protein LptD [Pseudomonadota bacterium]